MRLTLTVVAALAGAACAAARDAGFAHPGVLLGEKQLAFVLEQVGLGAVPFNETLVKAKMNTWVNSKNASSMFAGWNGTISCGYFDSDDYGCSNEGSDSTAVVVQAYLWAITRDEIWATRAINIINFYARNLKQYANWGNGPLEAAWASDKWSRAAELLVSTGAPWAAADVDAFRNVLQTVSVPMLWNGSCFNGNWELAMIEGMAGIAVFAENRTLWDRAIAMWRARLPAYFYMGSDGPKPVEVPVCKRAYWYDQLVFNSSVDGVSQETCRDFDHTSYGVASTFNVAETALIQGIDLYSPNQARLAAALEFHTGFLNAGGYPSGPYKPALRNVTDPLVCNGTVLKLSYAQTYQVGLTGLARLGLASQLPQTAQYVQQYLWNLYYNDACGDFMACYEALTHGAPAPAGAPFESRPYGHGAA